MFTGETELKDLPEIDELYHYGVKGMKWGKRKSKKTTYEEEIIPETKIEEEIIPETRIEEKKIFNFQLPEKIVSYGENIIKKILNKLKNKKLMHMDDSAYFEHYGILGQKWGVQNGPPYPLDKDGKIALKKQKKANSKKEEYEKVSQESARLISESEKHKGKTGRKMFEEGMDLRKKALKLEREMILESGPDVEDFSRAMLDWSAKSDLKFKKEVPEWYDESLFQKAVSTKEKESEFWNRYQKSITEIVDDWNSNYSKEGWKKMDNDDPNIFENFMNSSTSSAALNNDISINVDFYKKLPELMVDDDFFKHSDHLEHYGILGQKWGNQNGPPYPLNPSQKSYSEKKQARMDKKWVRKNDKKIRRYADSQSREELKAYEKELRKVMPKYNKNGKVNSNYATAYSKKMAELYNKAIGDLAVSSGSGSGKVVKFVAARGQMDVFTALADYGYDMSNVKNGVFNSGKIGYKKESVGVDHDERR